MLVYGLLSCFNSSATSVQAKIPIFFSWGGESIEKVEEFPDNESFMSADNHFFDAGIRYKQVSIFFIPIWNYDIEWCGYINDQMYLDFSKEELDSFASSANIKIPNEFQLSFWTEYGGKLLFALLVGGYLFISYVGSKQETSEQKAPAQL